MCFEDANFGQLASAVRDGEAEDFELGHKERRARASGSGNGFKGGVVVGQRNAGRETAHEGDG